MPSVNGGSLDLKSVQQAFDELDVFECMAETLNNYYLINVDNDAIMYEYIDAYAGQFFFAKPCCMGFNENGLYIIDSKTREILFQGKHVTQYVYFYPS